MMMSWSTIFFIVFATLSSSIIAEDPCIFKHSKGTIDLTSLANNNNQPAYKDVIPPAGSNYKYSYNPCKPFSEGNECQGVSACQVSMDGLFQFALGKQDTAAWNAGAGLGSNPSVSYSSGEKKVQVTLECIKDGTQSFEALGEDPMNFYKFRLTHKCACWDGCGGGPGPGPSTTTTSPGGGGGGIGGGGVFFILLLVLVVVYFVGFAVFYRVREQKSGVELIAHRTFWSALPGYAKDGTVFVYRKVTGKSDSYNSV